MTLTVRGMLLSGVIPILCASPVYAQTAPTAQPTPAVQPAANAAPSGEIIVTAQRKDEKLSRTPVAVTVLSADALTKQAIVTETDLRSAAPGLAVRATANSNQLNYAIRGQSLDAFSNNTPGVLPYFNEVQIGGAGTATAFYDLGSVQVLKGPQGTLFGRNATGGAVLFSSQKPTDQFGGYIDGGYGTYHSARVDGAINVPLIDDRLLVRVAGFYQSRDGFQYNLFTNSRTGDIERYGFRGSVTAKITDNLKNDLVVDYAHLSGGGTAGVIYSFYNAGALPTQALYAGGATTNAVINAIYNGPGAFNGAYPQFANAWADYLKTPGAVSIGATAELAAQRARGPFVVDLNGPNTSEARNLIVTNATTLDLGHNTQIKNILGYTKLISHTDYDTDGLPYALYEVLNNNYTKQFSDEIQLNGKTLSDRLSYVTGGYYGNDQSTIRLRSTTFGLAPDYNFINLPVSPQCVDASQCNDFKAQSKYYAGYAQGTYDLSELTDVRGLGFTAGGRFSKQDVSSTILPPDSTYLLGVTLGVIPGYAVKQSKSYQNFSWTLGVQDQINPDTLIYVVNRRAYRNGGYNGTSLSIPGDGTVGGNGFNTETVTDVEAGLKYSGNISGLRTSLNIAGFSTWIKNAQRSVFVVENNAPTAVSVNVPRARVSGVELDGSIRPVRWLSVGGALNYIDAKFTSNQVSVPNPPGPSQIETLGTYPDTPKWSGQIYADVTVPVRDQLSVILHGDMYAQTMIFYTSTGNVNTSAFFPGYAVADFRVGIESATGWSLTANLKNAFNRVYYAGGIAGGELIQSNTAIPGDPRTFLVEGKLKF